MKGAEIFLKRYIIILMILLSFLTSFAISVEDILNLSKNENTLELSWDEFLKYLSEFGYSEEIENAGRIISAKRFLYEKYSKYNFVKSIITEDFRAFSTNLSLIPPNFNFSEDDIEKLIIVFPNMVERVEDYLINPDESKNYVKYLYRIEKFEKRINITQYDIYINYLIKKSINNSTFLDESQKAFIVKYVPVVYLKKIDDIISNESFSIEEKDYIGAYKLLGFMKDINSINEKNLETYILLNSYFDIKQKLTSLNNSVYFVEKTDLNDFIEDSLSYIYKSQGLNIKHDLIDNLILNLLKTLNIKVGNLKEKMVLDFSRDKLNINAEINKEIDILYDQIESINKMKILDIDKKTNSSTETIKNLEQNKNESSDKDKKYNYLFIIIPILIIFILFVMIIEVFPNIRIAEFFVKMGLPIFSFRIINKLLLKEPNNFKYYIFLAKVYEKMDKYNESISTYKHAMKIKERGDFNE
ncbi:hypothetical protein M5Z94_01560 [Oceanotoga teriensis]|nr:hypothetical protein [Oceanotoga teriensis]